MKKITKLKWCDWGLLALSIIILLSGIQLEVLHGETVSWIWIHIAIGILFIALCGWHIWLHFGASNWFSRFHKQKNQVTRILWWVSLATFITGLIAMFHWIGEYGHSPIGGLHGKLGFLMMIFVAGHVAKRIKFYKRKKSA